MKKELIYPIIVGIVVSFVTLIGGVAVDNWRQPALLPPAQLIYSHNSDVITKDDLKELFPGKFNDDAESLIVVSHLTITNASGRSLKDIDIVATSKLYMDPKWISIDVDLDDVILKERINRSAIDENGNLRVKIEKFGRDGSLNLSVKSDTIAFSPTLDSPQENVEFRSINIPQYMYMKTEQPRSTGLIILISLINALLASVATYYYIQGRTKTDG
jgi:hypothetical protein